MPRKPRDYNYSSDDMTRTRVNRMRREARNFRKRAGVPAYSRPRLIRALELDAIARFVNENCVPEDFTEDARLLHAAYLEWCHDNGLLRVRHGDFVRLVTAVDELRYSIDPYTGVDYVTGLRLLDDMTGRERRAVNETWFHPTDAWERELDV